MRNGRGASGMAPAQDDDRGHREEERGPLDDHEVGGDGVEVAQHGHQQDRHPGLDQDRGVGRRPSRMHAAEELEGEAVAGHGVGHPRLGQDVPVQGAEHAAEDGGRR